MADDQAGGSGTTGQTTIEDSRKLSKVEAGFREDEGVPGLKCGVCQFFESGECQIVEGDIDPNDVCDEFEPNTKDGSMSTDQATETTREEPLSIIDMFITRVTKPDQKGVRRWFATASGIKEDLYKERMSVDLFNDFIRRIEEDERPPEPFISEAWNGGNPYLGIAHYLDLNGYGIVGPTDAIWVDGEILKAKGRFNDSPLADAAYKAIQEDIAINRADQERTRISIAFVDWGHNHGEGKEFERKSLRDQCMLCQAGVGDKEYTSGQLVHLALTRRPAYPEAEIVALEERSMSKRRDDAASIVGEELADELAKRSEELVGRSADGTEEIAPGAIVVKDDPRGEDDGLPLGGAVTLDQAEAFLTKSANGDHPVLLDSWAIFSTVLENIAGDEEKAASIREQVAEFQHTMDVQVARALLRLDAANGGDAMAEDDGKVVERQVPPQFLEKEEDEGRKRERRPEPEDVDEEAEAELEAEKEEAEAEEGEAEAEVEEDEDMDYEDEDKEKAMKKKSHPLDEYFAEVREAYDEAVETPGTPEQRLAMIQESFEGLGAGIQTTIAQASDQSGGIDESVIQKAIQDAVGKVVGPLQAEVMALRSELSDKREAPAGRVPGRRAMRFPNTPTHQPTERSVTEGPEEKKSETPKLQQIVRKSVGLRR